MHRSRLFDLALAAGLGVFGVALATWGASADGTLVVPWGMVALQALAALALVWRRRAPLTVLSVSLAATVLTTAGLLLAPGWVTPVDPETFVWVPVATPAAAYAALRYAPTRAAWALVWALTLIAARPWNPQPGTVVPTPFLTLYPAAVGWFAALRLRRLRADATREAEQARADERVRLAGEMHDVVTHRISLMVLQAGALRVTATDDATRSAAEELRAAGCQALEELRDLLGVLRAAPVPAPPADLSEFASSATVEVEGDPALASPIVARTAYRIVQEALTNVRKHAPGAPVTVRVRYAPAGVSLTVRNGAPTGPVDRGLAASGSGTGLLGLRERVELVSGVLRTGPGSDGGFVVEATLPAYVPTVAP